MPIREPLRFEPIPFQKVWGGRSLAPFLRRGLPALERIGEVWDVVDRADGSSRVASEGERTGRTLRELMREDPRGLLGEGPAAPGGFFPLLVKHIDAGEALSIQVHPDDRVAAQLGGDAAGKSEAWYVLAAEPGSRLWLGIHPDVDPDEFREKATSPAVVDLLRAFDVRPGQFFFVPAGTVHAIGAGIALVEIQQNSDTTYRLFDWGRVDDAGLARTTHRDEAFASVVHDSVPDPIAVTPRAGEAVRLVEAAPFCVCHRRLASATALHGDGRLRVYVALAGRGRLRVPATGSEWDVEVGDAWLVPASLEAWELAPEGAELDLLEVEGPR